MITHLRGILAYKAPTSAVVEIGGLGFGLAISVMTYQQLPAAGSEVALLTYLYVREDRLELFGFGTAEERQLFLLLNGVPGIGPHLAQTILSGMSAEDLRAAIFHNRIHELTAIKGIGRKTAERIVLDLRDKVTPGAPVAVATGGATAARGSEAAEEGIRALVALGIPAVQARHMVQQVLRTSGSGCGVEQLVKLALKQR
ncbi:MAG: Holliday junction branch migration protein RuvA [Candidatus Latescibacterota bacterium]